MLLYASRSLASNMWQGLPILQLSTVYHLVIFGEEADFILSQTIHVTNYHPDNGTTIHWHGVRQLYTNEADGVNGVTQCPIAMGDTYTYNFKATQYGHTWYHSHYSLQYPDGVAGPLLIHGPSSANWDEAWEPILINDWSHRSAFQDFQGELTGNPPSMQSVVLNGTGMHMKMTSE